MTPAEFAASIKAKYPQYASVPDDELAQKVIAKYPQYKSSVSFAAADVAARKANPPAAAMGDPNGKPTSTLDDIATAVNQTGQDLTINPAIRIAKNIGGMVTSGAQGHVADVKNAMRDFQNGDLASGTANAVKAWVPLSGSIEDAISPSIQAGADAVDAARHGEINNAARAAQHMNPTVNMVENAGNQIASGNAKDFIGDALTPVVMGGLIEGGVKGAGKVASKLSTDVAPQINRNLLNPKNSQMKFGADPGEFVTGITSDAGGGVGSLAPKIEAKIQGLESQADQVAFNTKAGQTVPIDYEGAIRNSFDRQIQSAMTDGNESLASRLAKVRDNEIELLKSKTGGSGQAPAMAGRAYQQGLGDRVRTFSEDPVDGTIRTARQGAWENIKDATDQAVPELAPINRQIHSGIEAKKAATERGLSESKANPLSLRQQLVNATVAGPYIKTRVAAGLRKLSPVAEAPAPQLVPNASSPYTPDPGQEIVNWFDRNKTVPQGDSVTGGQPEGSIVDRAQGGNADPRALARQIFDNARFRGEAPTRPTSSPETPYFQDPINPHSTSALINDIATAMKARGESNLLDMLTHQDLQNLAKEIMRRKATESLKSRGIEIVSR